MTKVQLGLTVCSVGPAAWEYTWPLWRRGDIYLNCARPGLLLLRTRISFVLDQSFKKRKEILNLTLSLLQSALWFCVSPKHLSWLVAGLLVPSQLTVACCKYKRSSCSNRTGGSAYKRKLKWGCKQTSGASILERIVFSSGVTRKSGRKKGNYRNICLACFFFHM